MSTPLLTPLDTAIFDEDVIGELEEHAEDEVSCERCETQAAARLVMKCCKKSGAFCGPHIEKSRDAATRIVVASCKTCGHGFLFPTFDDIYTVVPL